MAIHSDRDLRIERDGDALIIQHNTGGFNWGGAFFAGMGFIFVIAFLSSIGQLITFYGQMAWPASSGYTAVAWFTMSCATIGPIGYIAFGVLTMLPRVTTTVFNLRSRDVIHSTSICKRPHRSHRYAFDDLADIFLHAGSEAEACMPHIRLKARSRVLTLVHGGISLPSGLNLVETICTATGLPKRRDYFGST